MCVWAVANLFRSCSGRRWPYSRRRRPRIDKHKAALEANVYIFVLYSVRTVFISYYFCVSFSSLYRLLGDSTDYQLIISWLCIQLVERAALPLGSILDKLVDMVLCPVLAGRHLEDVSRAQQCFTGVAIRDNLKNTVKVFLKKGIRGGGVINQVVSGAGRGVFKLLDMPTKNCLFDGAP